MKMIVVAIHMPGEAVNVRQPSPIHPAPREAGTFCPSATSIAPSGEAASSTTALGGANGLSRSGVALMAGYFEQAPVYFASMCCSMFMGWPFCIICICMSMWNASPLKVILLFAVICGSVHVIV